MTRVGVRVVQNRGPQPGSGRFTAHHHFLLSFICQRIASIWDSKGSLFTSLLENIYLKMQLNREAWGGKKPSKHSKARCGGGIYNEIERQSWVRRSQPWFKPARLHFFEDLQPSKLFFFGYIRTQFSSPQLGSLLDMGLMGTGD